MDTPCLERSFGFCGTGKFKSVPLVLSGMRGVHGYTVNRGTEESWSSLIARAEAETRDTLEAFKPSNIFLRGQLLFNVVWQRSRIPESFHELFIT
jgi:hypothetical protein